MNTLVFYYRKKIYNCIINTLSGRLCLWSLPKKNVYIKDLNETVTNYLLQKNRVFPVLNLNDFYQIFHLPEYIY